VKIYRFFLKRRKKFYSLLLTVLILIGMGFFSGKKIFQISQDFQKNFPELSSFRKAVIPGNESAFYDSVGESFETKQGMGFLIQNSEISLPEPNLRLSRKTGTTIAESKMKAVRVNSANVRKRPSTESAKVGKAFLGMKGEVLETVAGWTKLFFRDLDLKGWVRDDLLDHVS